MIFFILVQTYSSQDQYSEKNGHDDPAFLTEDAIQCQQKDIVAKVFPDGEDVVYGCIIHHFN